jgi:hypothetical protein
MPYEVAPDALEVSWNDVSGGVAKISTFDRHENWPYEGNGKGQASLHCEE